VKTTVRCLYAEDNPLDADLTKTYFHEHAPEFDIEITGTGRLFLKRLTETEFDVLLLDNHLPDMDGVDVLKELLKTGLRFPVVMVTGVGDDELVVKALRLGASNYVSKQGKYFKTLPDLLHNVINEYQQEKRLGLPTIELQRRILYVETYAMDIDLTLRYFAEFAPHLTIDNANSSHEALDRLTVPNTYDLALIDLRMPEQNGLDLVREARRRNLALPPFIMITGKGDEAAAIAAMKLGAADYISKRDGYLDQLSHAIDRAIAYDRIKRLNEQMLIELAERRRAENERDEIEQHLRVSQKLEAIGTLASGVAHEINNPLNIIMNFGQLISDDQSDKERIKHYGDIIIQESERVAVIVRNLLSFARQDNVTLSRCELQDIVERTVSLMRAVLRRDQITVKCDVPEDLPQVMCRPQQIQQVLMNLITNARDAVNERYHDTECQKTITILASAFNRDGSCWIRLTVGDNGNGIRPETANRVFDPFFSTKARDKGTGLGLSISYGIVKEHGGDIRFETEPGKGTKFHIELKCDNAVNPDS
jgi:signal transduction histidine kinase